jgi:hypothetical protein
MPRVIIEGLSEAQAKHLANWFAHQGADQADMWFDEQRRTEPDLETPHIYRKGTGGPIHTYPNGDVSVTCKEMHLRRFIIVKSDTLSRDKPDEWKCWNDDTNDWTSRDNATVYTPDQINTPRDCGIQTAVEIRS